MEPWFPSSYSPFDEARRATVEPGRFPPTDPAMFECSQNLDYKFPTDLSPGSSHSSSGSPPPFPDSRRGINTGEHLSGQDPTNCIGFPSPNHYLPLSSSDQEHLRYQQQWKLEHLMEHSSPSGTYSVQNSNSASHDPHPGRSPARIPYHGQLVESECHSGQSSSPSPSSPHNHLQLSSIPQHHNGFARGYTFINQVFKPLYESDEDKLASRQLARTPMAADYASFVPIVKIDPHNPAASLPELCSQPLAPAVKKTKRQNEKRFPCPDCGRMFARAFNMETHRKTHIGYRPHQCPKCQKHFSRRHDLHRHLVAVHNDHRKLPLQPIIDQPGVSGAGNSGS